ncbi:hypothetical protein [Ralstonia pickettii]|uniref:hypothetical protein n=1 Tax=Ralstonia pickettii TaxID=329 RepID=UPI000818984B|nr:hypothetical protein [Ralstonia pickettii]OCS43686.1 hypothetical protein BEK67_01020 [Ralstonia pickettii]
MKGYFGFEWAGESKDNGTHTNVRVLFKPTGSCNDAELASAIEQSLDAVLAPDIITLICAESEVSELISAFRRPELIQAVRRASSKVCVALCSFDRTGSIRLRKQIRNPIKGLPSLFNLHSERIRNAGLAALFSSPHVLVTAPPGFTFVKPSQKRSTYFLRAEEALTETENVQFLAFCLLHKIAARQQEVKAPIDVIFIDSMAIATVAYALRDLYCSFYAQGHPRVESFHSHEGLAKVRSPLPGTSFCLISASSSMNLEREWRDRTSCYPSEVVTLLTLCSAKNSKSALHALNDERLSEGDSPTSSVLKDLPIVGERFLPEELLPKKVILRQREHELKESDLIANHLRLGCFSVRTRVNPAAKPRSIYFNGTKLLQVAEFSIFLDKILRQKVAASIQAIIHQDDEASLLFAKECSLRLTRFAKRQEPLPVYSQAEIEEGTVRLDECDAIAVVAAVVGRGTKLLSISRDLRNLHKGARTYIIGAQIAETRSEITSLGHNLKYSAEKAVIGVESFLSLAIGKGLSASFDAEYSSFQGLASVLGDQVSQRHMLLPGSTGGLTVNCFLPSGAYLDAPLRLREDFAYWPAGYKEGEDSGPAVFATISAILQRARDGQFSASEHRLSTDAFQQVVLAPENFARYNDGIIQAAILRAAHPSELDYSREAACSGFMFDFLLKTFQQSAKRQGEAAAEFALALSTGRLKLRNEDLARLKELIPEVLSDDTPLSLLVRRLLRLESPEIEEGLPEGF